MDTTTKIPPQNLHYEKIVLGTMLKRRDAIPAVLGLTKPVEFYSPQHQLVFTAIEKLHHKSAPVDIATVTNLLKDGQQFTKIGGLETLNGLLKETVGVEDVEFYAKTVHDKYISRETIRICEMGIANAYSDNSDIFDTLGFVQSELIGLHGQTGGEKMIGEVVVDTIQEVERMQQNPNESGVLTGFTDIDRMIGGWKAGKLIILGARPAVGKSSLAQLFALNPALSGTPTAIISLEMTKNELGGRILSVHASVNGAKIANGWVSPVEWGQIIKSGNALADVPLVIDDTNSIKESQARAKILSFVQKYGVKLVVIDYLQLMEGDGKKGGNREQEISGLARMLKRTAGDAQIPIIVLSQLNRELDKRADKRPVLSDLRESGSIEQDADIVCFLYRPKSHNITHDENNNEYKVGYAEFNIAKQRGGKTGTVVLHFEESFTRFEDAQVMDYVPSKLTPMREAADKDGFYD